MDTVTVAERETVEVVDGVYLTQLAAGDRTSIQHFRVEPDAEVPEHSHHHEQTGFVYAGALTFRIDGAEYVVGTNESFTVPSEEPHAAVNEGDDPARGIDVFAPPRPNPDWDV